MMRFTKGILLAAVSMAATTAHAQTAEDDAVAGNPDEIIVTATRRAERLQDVPIAVSVLTGEKLAESGFKSLADIQYQSPGVYVGETPNDAGIRLRGVGSAGGFSSSSEQNVGMVVDGVVVPFGSPVNSLGDLERVEILKGPQGTQFGKNASSGVVSITTKRPDLTKASGDMFVSYGELRELDVHGSLNLPLSNTLGTQFYAFSRSFDGFVDNIVQKRKWGGQLSQGARGKLLWEPTEDFSAYLIGDYSRTRTRGIQQLWTINRLSPTPDPFFNPPFNTLVAGLRLGAGNDVSIEDYGGDQVTENFGVSLQLDKQFGDYSLTSVTAFRRLESDPLIFAIDATNLPRFTAQNYGNASNFYSQELRLASPSDTAFDFVAGVYLSRLEGSVGEGQSAQLRPNPASAATIVSISNGIGQATTKTNSYAAFFDGQLRLADKLRLLIGGRLTRDEVSASTSSRLDPAFPPGPSSIGFVVPYTAVPLRTASTAATDWSGRIGLEYKPTTDLLFYATAARGYLGPTVTFSILTTTQSNVQPQTVIDVTVGAKMQFLDRRLTLNVNAFHDNYDNLQTSVFTNGEFLTGNAGGLKTTGFEIEASYRVSRVLSFSAGYTYAHARFTEYLTDCPIEITLGQRPGVCNLGPSGNRYQAAGDDLPGAPRSTLTLGSNLQVPLGGGLMFDGAASFYYRSSVYQTAGEQYTRMPGYEIVGLNAGIGAEDGAWRVGVFARNLFDKEFNVGLLDVPFANTGTLVNWKTREGRRTIGVSGQIRF